MFRLILANTTHRYEVARSMSEHQTEKNRTRHSPLRLVRRVVTLLAALLVVGVVLLVVGAAGVWGYFWEFRVGDPTSDSCANCHVMDSYVQSLTTTGVLGGTHAAKDIACVDCHEYDLNHQLNDTMAYLGGSYTEPLERASYEMDFCFQCHEHGSYDQISWRTMDMGVSDQQAKGHDANPHRSPHYAELECNVCHQVHTPSTLFCWECHAFDFGNPQFVRGAVAAVAPELTPEATPETTSAN